MSALCIQKEFPRVKPQKGEYVVVLADSDVKDMTEQLVIMITLRPYNKKQPVQIEERPNSIATLLDTDGVLTGYKRLKPVLAAPILNLLVNHVRACAA